MKRVYQYLLSFAQGGHRWQFALIAMLLSVLAVYTITHYIWQDRRGKEFVQLNKGQMDVINASIMVNPDSNLHCEALLLQRKERDAFIINYLQTEYHHNIDAAYLSDLRYLMAKQSSKDLFSYLSKARILIRGPFWLTGNTIYVEAFFWSVFGVLVSLIYYVSLANAKGSTVAGADENDSFNPREVPGQLAKLFYAPACTMVILLGYHIISSSDNMVDISANKGLLVFSFIAGFYSIRLMKFMDRLKDLLLPSVASPLRSEAAGAKPAAPPAVATVKVILKTDGGMRAEVKKQLETSGYQEAEVKLTPEAGGDAIVLSSAGKDQPSIFTADKVKPGNYHVLANLKLGNGQQSTLLLTANMTKELKAGENTLELELQEDMAEG